MKYTVISFFLILLISCNDPFINHKLQYEKLGDCAGYSNAINMISNINGERYEFFSCIDDGFDGKNYSVNRTGDSIIVSFPKNTAAKKTLYKLILDVDAKPRYNHIIIDERPITVVSAEK